ncbi:hypothetical protein HDU80_003256 [Chytriomyces hyalinus]|nr:hypothetical protein HDU80_003256 [Chytriomyces hyalinus]
MSDLLILSTGGLFPHTHKLTIPRSAVANPPQEGLVLETSEEISAFVFKHKHPVVITLDQLIAIGKGETVQVHDQDTNRHTFSITLAE